MAKVLCFGSLNIDYVYQVDHFVQAGETLASTGLNVYSGGKGLNQSCAFGKAGCETSHAGCIGQDGLFLLDILKESHVNTSLVKVSGDVRTGNAIIQNNKEGNNCILLYPGANFAVTKDYVDEVLSHFEAGDYLILQNEISCLEYLTTSAKKKGLIPVLNPSPYNQAITETVLASADWLILNEIEAMAVTGSTDDSEEALADQLRTHFPGKKIVLTLGGRGSAYLDARSHVHQDIFAVKTVDTTAAGDTFTGYFFAGIIQGWAPEKCLRTASKASSIAVSRKGAAPSIPWAEEVAK